MIISLEGSLRLAELRLLVGEQVLHLLLGLSEADLNDVLFVQLGRFLVWVESLQQLVLVTLTVHMTQFKTVITVRVCTSHVVHEPFG